jgi:hypothetical protein
MYWDTRMQAQISSVSQLCCRIVLPAEPRLYHLLQALRQKEKLYSECAGFGQHPLLDTPGRSCRPHKEHRTTHVKLFRHIDLA